MEANKTVTPTLPKMYVDPHQPGLIRWDGCDPFAGILAGVKAPAIVRACNAHEEMVKALQALSDVGALSEYIGGGEEVAAAQKLARAALAKAGAA